jgi:hypothetical protein
MSKVRTGGRGPCPKCGGEGEATLGPLRLSCQECGGSGRVGGDDEPRYRPDGYKLPEEGEEYDPDIHGPLPPVGTHPAVSSSALCPKCLSQGVILTEALAETPCPACSPPHP